MPRSAPPLLRHRMNPMDNESKISDNELLHHIADLLEEVAAACGYLVMLALNQGERLTLIQRAVQLEKPEGAE